MVSPCYNFGANHFPLYKYRLHIPESHASTVTFKSGVVLLQDTRFDHEEKVAPKGVVTFVPDIIVAADEQSWCSGSSYGIAVGDVVFIRYDVVADSDLLHTGERVYHNQVITDSGKEWMCGIDQIFAVERDGEMVMLGNNVLCSQFVEVKEQAGLIILPEMSKKKAIDNVAIVENVPEQKGRNKRNIQKGDKVYTRLMYAGKYNFSGVYGEDKYVVNMDYIDMKLS